MTFQSVFVYPEKSSVLRAVGGGDSSAVQEEGGAPHPDRGVRTHRKLHTGRRDVSEPDPKNVDRGREGRGRRVGGAPSTALSHC